MKTIWHIYTGCPKSCFIDVLKYSTVIFITSGVPHTHTHTVCGAVGTLAHVSVNLILPRFEASQTSSNLQPLFLSRSGLELNIAHGFFLLVSLTTFVPSFTLFLSSSGMSPFPPLYLHLPSVSRQLAFISSPVMR